MSGAPGCRMNGAVGRSVLGLSVGRRGLFLCAILIAFTFGGAIQSQESNTSQQQQSTSQPSNPAPQTGQEPNSSPATKTQSPYETIEVNTQSTVPFQSHVNLVPVRVIVHDGSGKVVTDLTKEDFRLFQDRRPQTISNFSVETPASAAQQVVRGVASNASAEQTDAAVAGNLELPSRFV